MESFPEANGTGPATAFSMRNPSWKWLFVLSLLFIVPWRACHYSERSRQLSYIPDAMGVSRVLYAEEDDFGSIGLPGDNETGIILYEMPDAVAKALSSNAQKYLNDISEPAGGDWRGKFENWHETPVIFDEQWPRGGKYEGRWQWVSPGIGDYMGRYFAMPFDASVERLVNDAIFKPGSYYAYGRIGLIILIPSMQRVVFVYSG